MTAGFDGDRELVRVLASAVLVQEPRGVPVKGDTSLLWRGR